MNYALAGQLVVATIIACLVVFGISEVVIARIEELERRKIERLAAAARYADRQLRKLSA
jgi:hypothetical protein